MITVMLASCDRIAIRSTTYNSSNMEPSVRAGSTIEFELCRIDAVSRGDIIVYWEDQNEEVLFAGRVVGLPGDTIMANDKGVLIINESVYEMDDIKSVASYPVSGSSASGEVSFLDEEVFSIEDDEIFVVSDKWRSSKDSRFLGPVPGAQFVGLVIE